MPFTVSGEWVPNKSIPKSTQPVKVRLVKRGSNVLTIILNLNLSGKELIELTSTIKKKLACGGSIKNNDIEIQGDNVAKVIAILKDMGIKSS